MFSLAWDDVQLTLKVGFICPVIKSPPPILEHFCPLLAQIEQMGLILPRWGLTLPRIPPPTPVTALFFTQPSYTPCGDMYIHKTHPSPPKIPAVLGLNLKVVKINYRLGNLNPTGQNVWRVGKTFLEVGQKTYWLNIVLVRWRGHVSYCSNLNKDDKDGIERHHRVKKG